MPNTCRERPASISGRRWSWSAGKTSTGTRPRRDRFVPAASAVLCSKSYLALILGKQQVCGRPLLFVLVLIFSRLRRLDLYLGILENFFVLFRQFKRTDGDDAVAARESFGN